MESAIREAEAVYGKTDLLVNCAGLMLLGYPDKQDFEEWERMIDVNVKGILTGTKTVWACSMQCLCLNSPQSSYGMYADSTAIV